MPERQLHSDTDIYKAVVALAKFSVLAVRQMPRDVKRVIGDLLRDETLWMGVLVMRTNIAREEAKIPHLVELLEHLELVSMGLRIAHELGFIARATWAQSIPLVASVGKQANGIDFVGQVIEPHRRTIRRRTYHAALHRLVAMPAAELHQSANSYFGLLRQATHGHRDRARLANLVRRRGLAVDHQLTKAYAHG